jgi:micrococcal nuclease
MGMFPLILALFIVVVAVTSYFHYDVGVHAEKAERKKHNPALPRFTGAVTRVIDGDTIDVSDGRRIYRVRICGMDAPESGQEFGEEAATALRKVVGGKTVTVTGVEIDKYDRLVAYVDYSGQNLGVAMCAAGLAWADKFGANPKAYILAEHQARAARKGLWRGSGGPAPVYPAEFRAQHAE